MKIRSYDPYVFVKICLISTFTLFAFLASAQANYYCGPSDDIKASVCTLEIGETVQLEYTGGGTYEALAWDGVTGNVTHNTSWSTAGTKRVTLQVIYCEPGECEGPPWSRVEYIDITVTAPPPPFRAELDGPSTVCIDDQAFFVATCLPGYSIFTWRIDGEDQTMNDVEITTTSSLKTLRFPLYYFSTTGNHTVEFYAMCDDLHNACGGDLATDGFASMNVYVSPKPNASIVASTVSGCGAYAVDLTIANIESGASYQWVSDDGQVASGSAVTMTAGLNGRSNTKFTVTATRGVCQNIESTTLTSWVTSYGAIHVSTYHKSFVKFEYIGSGYTPLSSHYWQETPQGTNTGHSLANDPYEGFIITEPMTYYINALNPSANCWTSDQGPYNIPISYTPPQVTVTQNQKYGHNEITFDVSDKAFVLQYADYYVTDSPSIEIADPNKKINEIFRVFKEGTHYIRGVDRATNTWGSATAFEVVLMKDYPLNWIHTASFDGNGDKIAESKNYFDYSGKALQSQSKNITANRILATESLYDRFDRVAGSTLPAPILSTEFNYNGLFLMNMDGEKYKTDDFDGPSTLFSPRPVNTAEGTIGWYYSNRNSDEPHTPITQYPYSRVEFYEEGFEEAKKSAGPGDQLRLGTGHEIVSGTFPVYNELDDYLINRSVAIPGISTPHSSLTNEVMQTVTRDQNGRFVILISDKSGNNLMSARAGTASDHGLQIDNSIVASADVSSPNHKTVVYMYLLNQQAVTIGGSGSYEVDDILDNENFTSSGEWPAGFYRVRILSGEVNFSYSNYYQDVSYNYYDDIGRLVSSISPNGVVSLLNSNEVYKNDFETDFSQFQSDGTIVLSLNNGRLKVANASLWNAAYITLATEADHLYEVSFYADLDGVGSIDAFSSGNSQNLSQIRINNNGTHSHQFKAVSSSTLILFGNAVDGTQRNFFLDNVNIRDLGENELLLDKTVYQYNHQGWLLSMTETDAGTTQYGYRKDGSIRFSQNAEQQAHNKYSYTNYDVSGRPVESGEYGAPGGLLFNDVISNSIVLESHNDSWMVCDPAQTRKDWVKTHYDLPYPGLSVILPGKAQDFLMGSVSWTENANIRTWYSYDELGRVSWMAQQPLAMGNMIFLTEYSYDFLDNVLVVANKSRITGSTTDKSQFYHHYTYDADKRLSQVHTSLDGSTMKLQARYDYYLHGPLKRIELAGNLQGIDFVYNISGWLQSINDPSSDPGKDGETGGNSQFRKDAFGMVLDYYESSLQIFEPAGILKLNDPLQYHHIPQLESKETHLVSQVLNPPLFKDELWKSFKSRNNGSNINSGGGE